MEENLSKSKYNISLRILERVSDMQTKAAGYYRNGQVEQWFFEWKNIKFQIIGKLDAEEKKELRGMESIISRKLINKREVVPLIEQYLEYLQYLIEIKEIGLVSKSDETIFA